MKKLNNARLLSLLSFCLVAQLSWAQTPLVNEVSVAPNEARLELSANSPQSYFMEITGPDNFYTSEELKDITDIRLMPQQQDGTAFLDGSYRIQLTPVYRLTPEQQSDLVGMRQRGDEAGITAYRKANNLPTEANVYAINFGVHNGQFVEPNKREEALRTPGISQRQQNYADPAAIYASLNYFETDLNPSMVRDNSMEEDAQVFTQDVIAQGSFCVGIDCSSSESFGFDTHRLKENNLRIHFDDTSNSASFPANDWRLVANDTDNGGANHFSIEDATGGRTPFRIIAGAPTNSLWVNASGNIGIGTPSPVVEVHLRDGDSPTYRLEQDGSSGFTSQTWDIAGNETNFFIRDVTNGSALPFKIRPGADDNSLVIDNDNNIGIGVLDATSKLHVKSGDVHIEAGNLGVNTAPSAGNSLKVEGNTRLAGTLLVTSGATFRANTNFQMSAGNRTNFTAADFSTILHLNADNGRVGIGTGSPNHALQVASDDVAKPNGGPWLGASDRRLKTNIRDFKDGLTQLMAIRPVRYNYNGLLDLPTEPDFVGVIAQEMQAIAPYTVRDYNELSPDGDQYLAFDGSALTYILVNAVQEQQEIIEAQEARISQLEAQAGQLAQLQQQVAALAKVLDAQTASTTTTKTVETEER